MNNDYTMLASSRPNELLKKIKKKAQMQADMHGQLADFILGRQNFLLYGTLFTSVLMLSLTFASDEFMARTTSLTPDCFVWIRASIGILNFFVGLVLTIWRPSDHEAKHREAVRHYTRILYDIRRLEERGNITEEDVKMIENHYLKDSSVPPIPDKYFLKLKKGYLVKVSMSKFLEEHPHAWIWWVKVRLWFRELRSGSLPGDSC